MKAIDLFCHSGIGRPSSQSQPCFRFSAAWMQRALSLFPALSKQLYLVRWPGLAAESPAAAQPAVLREPAGFSGPLVPGEFASIAKSLQHFAGL